MGQVRKPEQDAGLAPRLRLRRMEGRSGVLSFGGRERKGSRERPHPVPPPEGQNEHLENELKQDGPLLGPEA